MKPPLKFPTNFRIGLIYVIAVLSLIANIILLIQSRDSQIAKTLSSKAKQYPFISKRVLLDLPQDLLIRFNPLREQLNRETSSYKDKVAIYFEYLPTGTSIGINSNDRIPSASLFKVPVVMAYYDNRERTGTNKDSEVTIREDDLDNRYGDLWKRGAGAKIMLSEAVRLAIEESDNTAYRVLVDQIDQKDLEDVYNGLDLGIITDDKERILISPREFASILKALFFSSVLDTSDSEKILELLAQTSFTDEIPAGLPKGIKIAHKIGIEANESFSDCGIIYAPKRPYILCMSYKGTEVQAEEKMARISKIIYNYVVTQNP